MTSTLLSQRVGVWTHHLLNIPMPQVREMAVRVEALGYPCLWGPEDLGGREVFALQSALLAATTTLCTGSGIANIWARHPAAMAGGAETMGEVFPYRFTLGVGVSHAQIVEPRGVVYEKPLTKMRGYLTEMDEASASRRDADLTQLVGPDSSTHAGNVTRTVPRFLAALRPGMLRLARDMADGVIPYFAPIRHTAVAREVLGQDKTIIPVQAVLVTEDLELGYRQARAYVAPYLYLPNYVNSLLELGYTDEDIAGGGSEQLVRDLVQVGPAEVVCAALRRQFEAGADQVLVHPLGEPEELLGQLQKLASTFPASQD